MHYITGQDRQQAQFFTKLDDLITSHHYVRLIDLIAEKFVSDNLTLFQLKGVQKIGRKAYHPAVLLKLYIYGYLNGISSSRKLEKECMRNLELMWLMSQLVPDHKTISDFRKENGIAIKQSVLTFNKWLQQAGYIKGETISIDGSKIRANASRSFDIEGITRKLEQLEVQLCEYLENLASTDQSEEDQEQIKMEKQRLEKQVLELKEQVKELEQKRALLMSSKAKTLSSTDPEARIMKSRQGKHFCYNVQVVVDQQHKLIVCNEVYNQENDRGLLVPMVEQSKEVLLNSPSEVLADAGYYQINQLEELDNKGIECYVAINENQEQAKEDQHGITFEYIEQKNHYLCSRGQLLKPQHGIKRDSRRGTEAQAYKGINCQPCSVKSICTTSEKARTVYRYSNQRWRDCYRSKMKSNLGSTKLRLRKALSEHPFGRLKYWMGHIPILLRGKQKVQIEMDIYTIAYNFKRMLNLTSFDQLKVLIEKKRLSVADA
jgi:transposase